MDQGWTIDIDAVGDAASATDRFENQLAAFEEALKKRFGPKSLEGLTVPADGMASDIHGSAEYRAHLVGVLARRAVAAAVG